MSGSSEKQPRKTPTFAGAQIPNAAPRMSLMVKSREYPLTIDDQAIYFQCPTCKAETCFCCGEYAHPKRTCEEYKRYVQDRGIPGDAPTVAYLNKVSVTCYSCSALLQRVEGCVLISCLNCRSQCCAGCGGRGHGHECRRLPVVG